MKNGTAILLAALLISISIIFTGVFVGLSVSKTFHDSETATAQEPVLMRDEQAAQYLGISVENFRVMLTKDTVARSSIQGIYDTYQFIPFMYVDKIKYFSKTELDKWVEYNMYNLYNK